MNYLIYMLIMFLNTCCKSIILSKLDKKNKFQLDVFNNALLSYMKSESPTISYNTQNWSYAIGLIIFELIYVISIIILNDRTVIISIIILIVILIFIILLRGYTITCGRSIKIRQNKINIKEFEEEFGFNEFKNPQITKHWAFSEVEIYKNNSKFLMIRKNCLSGYTEKVISPSFSYSISFGFIVIIKCGDRQFRTTTCCIDLEELHSFMNDEELIDLAEFEI